MLPAYLGDGVLAYFGYPVAHEEDAQRAVRAGLGLLEAIDPLNTRLALPLLIEWPCGYGVHTGVVVVKTSGQGPPRAPGAGETPNIAAPTATAGGAQYASDLRRDVSPHRGLFHV